MVVYRIYTNSTMGGWVEIDDDGAPYATEAAAEAVIAGRRALGGEWAEAEYRIDEEEVDD